MRRYFFLCLIIIQPYIFSQSLFNPPIVGGVTDTKAKIFVRTDASAEIQFIYSKDSLFSSLNIIPFTTQPDSYFLK
jgi:hypothetical protein